MRLRQFIPCNLLVLQIASGHHGALTRSQVSSLCAACGKPLGNLDMPCKTEAFKLSKKARRRLKKKAKSKQDSLRKYIECSAAVSKQCGLCGKSAVEFYPTIEAAQNAAQIGKPNEEKSQLQIS